MPSTVEIKYQLLTLWLNDQMAKEAAETAEAAAGETGLASASGGRDAAH